MLIPQRVLGAIRPTLSVAVLISLAATTAVFTATPFLLPATSREFDVALSTVGWMSTAQLAGFVIASWVGGRFLRPVRSTFIVGTVIGIAANLASALAPNFPILAMTRFASGISLGLAAWFAWQAAFGDRDKTGDAAVVGPLIGIVLAPTVAFALDQVGLRAVFAAMAVLMVLPLLFAGQIERSMQLRPHVSRHAATRAARIILLALGLITFGGSSVFVYGAAIGEELDGLSPVTVSLVYSGNAIASIPAARWRGSRGPAGIWFILTAVSAFFMAFSRSGIVFALALVGWGFVFFMGVPAAFGLLAARSRFPEERAGDAQAVMAFGRVFGPLLGGALLGSGSTTSLAIVSAGVLTGAAMLLLYVDRQRFLVVRSVDAPQHA
ncbi:MAG: MFS transporter [Actinomycetota bacterium]